MPAMEMPVLSTIGLWLFVFFFVFRYLRTIVSIFAFNLYKPKPVLENPAYSPRDVSVIIPTTFKKPDELVTCVKRILAAGPAKIFIVTADANVPLVKELCGLKSFGPTVEVFGVDKLNKRTQLLRGVESVKTAITVLADDDVFWPNDYLRYLLAIFEDPMVGAGGCRQRVQRLDKPDFCNFLGIAYLERRVWNNSASNAIDGGISTLSGRTAAYRTCILKDMSFQWYFTHDMWRGKPLNSDDDKCLTRYVYSHGWKIVLQFDERSVIETTVEPDMRGYLAQCMRWARAHWRGNFTVMENESYWRSFRYIWSFYFIYVSQFQTPSLLVDILMFFLLSLALTDASVSTAQTAYALLGAWIFFTKIMKLIPHFLRHPSDMRFIPGSILFAYFHGFLNVYALMTMHVTHWGSQNLHELATKRADKDEVVPLLRKTLLKVDGYREPTPGKIVHGDDYFSAIISQTE